MAICLARVLLEIVWSVSPAHTLINYSVVKFWPCSEHVRVILVLLINAEVLTSTFKTLEIEEVLLGTVSSCLLTSQTSEKIAVLYHQSWHKSCVEGTCAEYLGVVLNVCFGKLRRDFTRARARCKFSSFLAHTIYVWLCWRWLSVLILETKLYFLHSFCIFLLTMLTRSNAGDLIFSPKWSPHSKRCLSI